MIIEYKTKRLKSPVISLFLYFSLFSKRKLFKTLRIRNEIKVKTIIINTILPYVSDHKTLPIYGRDMNCKTEIGSITAIIFSNISFIIDFRIFKTLALLNYCSNFG